jgi:hypothetical protein
MMPAATVPDYRSALSAGPAAIGAVGLVDDMRALVKSMQPRTTAEALRVLRNAFPNAPLGMRVAACCG